MFLYASISPEEFIKMPKSKKDWFLKIEFNYVYLSV